MYANPKHLRDHEIKLRVDEDTYHLIRAMACFSHTQPAVLVHHLVQGGLNEMVQVLAANPNKNNSVA